MSASGEASESLRQSPNVGAKRDPADRETTAPFEGWKENKTVKTCVCEVCGDKVNNGKESHQCIICLRHICTQCQARDRAKSDWHHEAAMDHLRNGCWCKKWRSNMNPAFARRKPQPAPRPEEEQKAKTAKGKAKATHAAKSADKTEGKNEVKQEVELSLQASIDLSEDGGEAGGDDSYWTLYGISTPHVTLKRIRSVSEDADDLTEVVSKAQKKTGIDTNFELLQISSPKSTTARHTPKHMRNGHTVIVGAGMVGLFVARELALATMETGMEHDITVVDVRSKPCELASGRCNGLLSTVDMPESWNPVALAAKEAWANLLESLQFRATVNFSDTSLLFATKGERNAGIECPSWFTKKEGVRLEKDSDAIGRIDAENLATWLYKECQDLGVRFEFNRTVTNPQFSEDSRLHQLEIISPHQREGLTIEKQCTNLVIAAGPFTTGCLARLFDNIAPVVENHIQAAHWMRITHPTDSVEEADIAIRLPEAAQSKDKWRNEIVVLGSVTNRSLAISGYSAEISNEDSTIDEARNTKSCKATRLRSFAMPYLEVNQGLGPKRIEAEGAEVSTGYDEAPVIDRVPPSSLGLPIKDDAEDMHPYGIWVCYGFGRHGTFLAPGAAKMLVERMIGGGAGQEEFRLPLRETYLARDEAKAKARAEAEGMLAPNASDDLG